MTPEDLTPQPSDPETWVDRYGDALFRFALGRLRNAENAEEAVQETLLAAFRAKDRFSGRSSELTWLVGILKNKIADQYRRRSRMVPATDLGPESESVARLFDERGKWREKPAAWKVDPAALLQREEFLSVLADCLEGVPDRQAEAFSLRVLDEQNTDEVCKLLGVTATNLGVLIHRARQRLRQCLEERWFLRENE